MIYLVNDISNLNNNYFVSWFFFGNVRVVEFWWLVSVEENLDSFCIFWIYLFIDSGFCGDKNVFEVNRKEYFWLDLFFLNYGGKIEKNFLFIVEVN